MAKSKKTPQDHIPDMVEEILTVVQKRIDLLQKIEEPTCENAIECLKLITALSSNYLTYRALKAEARKDIQLLSPERIKQIIQHVPQN